MPKAVACFRVVNWQVLPYPTDSKYVDAFEVHALRTNLLNLDRAVHEWLGLLYYLLQGRIEDLFPAQ
jgi:uncharacterized SAM-binding protein YcdF (DUF218 family)